MTTGKKIFRGKAAKRAKADKVVGHGRAAKHSADSRAKAQPELGSALRDALASGIFVEAKPLTKLTPGDMIREVRELQELSQVELASMTGLTQAAISALENNIQTLGIERAKVLARALKIHPAALAFPNWDVEEESA